MDQWLIIGISGATCAGKTTLGEGLLKYFHENQGQEIKPGIEINHIEIVKQDEYQRKGDDPHLKKNEVLNHINWETIDCIDTSKMDSDIKEILGKDFSIYNTKSLLEFWNDHKNNKHDYAAKIYEPKMSCDYKSNVKKILLNVLVIEGYLVFVHLPLLDLCNIKFQLLISHDVCLYRRQQRGYEHPDPPGYFELLVWQEYIKSFDLYASRADIKLLDGEESPEKCFDSALKGIEQEIQSIFYGDI